MTRYDLSFIPLDVAARNTELFRDLRRVLEQDQPIDEGQLRPFFDDFWNLSAPDTYSVLYILGLILWRYAHENAQKFCAGELAATVLDKMKDICDHASGDVVMHAQRFLELNKF